MKACLNLMGILVLLVSNIPFADAVGPRMNYKCIYVHTVTSQNPADNRSSITFYDEVLLPSLCPPIPADVYKSVDPVAFSKHFDIGTQPTSVERPEDLSCQHESRPPVYTPIR